MLKIKRGGFTLVELLAVIAILGLIIIIAVPKITSTMNNSKRRTLELTVKSIARSAEETYIQNESFGITDEITCESVVDISRNEYEFCRIDFDSEGNASVMYVGKGSYDGLYVCGGTKANATATDEACGNTDDDVVVQAVNFTDDDWTTIVAAVQSGNHPYQVGDTKTVELGNDSGVYTIRVANTTKCSEVEVESKTACGFVLEFSDIITTYNINPSGEYYGTQYDYGTNLGGWPASAMRTYVNETIYNALPEELRKGIINTYVVSSYGSDKTTGVVENENAGVLEDGNYWSKDKLYLLSPQEVYGTSFTESSDTSNGTSRQLDYYAEYKGVDSNGAEYTGVSTTNYGGSKKQNAGSDSWWWLRSATSDSDNIFYIVSYIGAWFGINAKIPGGVSPAFRLVD